VLNGFDAVASLLLSKGAIVDRSKRAQEVALSCYAGGY
jgi:hypothetical protein